MVSSLQDLNFDKAVKAVQHEMARRSNPHNMQQPNENNTSRPKANLAQRGSFDSGGRSRRRGRRGKRVGQRGTSDDRIDKRTCNYLKHPSHFYNECGDGLRDKGHEVDKHIKDVPHRVPIEICTSARNFRTVILLVVIFATMLTPHSQLRN